MALTRPRHQNHQETRVARGTNLAALIGVEVKKEAGTAPGDAASGFLDLALAIGYHAPGALVDLVLLKLLAAGQVDQDRPGLVVRPKHLREVRLNVARVDVPRLHSLPPSRLVSSRASLKR